MASQDVIVVGGGIIGSAIALRLAQEKLRVLLLDQQEPGREASWAAAGMLSPAPDSPSSIPLVPFGRASLNLYPKFIAEIEELSGQTSGYRSEGTIEVMFSAEAERELSTLVALHHGLGLPTEPLALEEAREMEPALGREARATAFLPYEASVDPRALMGAVLGAARSAGVEIRPQTRVTRLLTKSGRCGGVLAAGENFVAGETILAAGAFSGRILGIPVSGVPGATASHGKDGAAAVETRPIRGQMVALRSAGPKLRRVLRCERGYIVPRGDSMPQHLVAGSTLEDAGFDKRVTPHGLEQIFSTIQEMAPSLGAAEIVETWSGLRPDTPDHLPLLGPGACLGLTVATGHYRNGILLAPITAQLVREWITEQRVSMDWEIYNPLRLARARSGNDEPLGARA